MKFPDPKASVTDLPLQGLINVLLWTRLISLLAILSTLAGACLMFWLGTVDTIHVFQSILLATTEKQLTSDANVIATVELLETLDAFLVGLAFLYFAYGIYALFIRLTIDKNDPPWLRVDSISSLKKTLLELSVVLLSVVFIRGVLEHAESLTLDWNLLVIPLSILAIALATRVMLPERKHPAD